MSPVATSALEVNIQVKLRAIVSAFDNSSDQIIQRPVRRASTGLGLHQSVAGPKLIFHCAEHSVAMAQERFQSPPAADDFPSDLGQQLMQHNAGTRYMPNSYAADQHNFVHSETNSGYVTPEPNQMLEQHGMPFFDPYTNQYDPGPIAGTVGSFTIAKGGAGS